MSDRTEHNQNKVVVGGVTSTYFPFFCAQKSLHQNGCTLIVLNRDDCVGKLISQLKILAPNTPVYSFPAWDCLPYDRVSPSSFITHERLNTLYALNEEKSSNIIVVTSLAALGQYTISPEIVKSENIYLEVSKDYPRSTLLYLLEQKGCKRVESVYENGEFAVRGSLIDFFPQGSSLPIRLDFFGDTLESIRYFDPLTQMTLVSEKLSGFYVRLNHEISLNIECINNFKSKYRQLFGATRYFPSQDPFYLNISDGRLHPGMEHWLPLFDSSRSTLLNYIEPSLVILEDGFNHALKARIESIHDYYQMRVNPPFSNDSLPYNPLQPSELYWTLSQWSHFYEQENVIHTSHFIQSDKDNCVNTKVLPSFSNDRLQSLDSLCIAIEKYLKSHAHIHKIIACQSNGSRDRIIKILQDHHVDLCLLEISNFPTDIFISQKPVENIVNIIVFPLEVGFEAPNFVVITEKDILGENLNYQKNKVRKNASFFQELSQFNQNDLMVHRNHGIGRYLGLETVMVDGYQHDCLMLQYDNDDKLFLPVENIELISRYGDADSLATLDRLGSNAWMNRKAKIRKRIQIVADYLIQVAAERSLKEGVVFKNKSQEYADFCAKFPYVETDDQLQAIEEVLSDVNSGRPMDRLICGDVGFGKTEIALRAAFLAVMNGKQVAVIVPTTLLARQHYATFLKRFHGFNINIKQLSRLVSAKESSHTKTALAQGDVNIVIATHALLSSTAKFHDLGLVIIDEEQHFGVKQKEKLKELRSDVHVLTLTATPIPRTLQLSLTGVRDLSLITTPPIDRLAVRTFVLPYDAIVIRDAILREYNRGGQIFYVTPRLEDLPSLMDTIQNLVPSMKIGIAHGQLSATELEDVMTGFYDRQFDLLLSTNIVESGIDIPTANTLIIHKCDLFGLSQLYQLRGRVGRAKTQGYAYFTYPENRQLSTNATKRLQVLQSLDTLGAGFTLASHDLDIRGAGNIVGEEQSGHIREVGVELYQTLLQEAIVMARAKEAIYEDGIPQEDWTPQIHLGVPILIPELYVADLNLRLNLYKRISNLSNRSEIDRMAAELTDRFGKLPPEVINLFDVIDLKNYCRAALIEKVEVGPKGILITFYKNQVEDQAKLFSFLQQPALNKEGAIKIRPDQKIFFARDFSDPRIKRTHTLKLIQALAAALS